MKTKPKQRNPDGAEMSSSELAARRYGTYEMVQIWGAERTMEYQLKVQGQAALTLNRLHPEIVPAKEAALIAETATLRRIDAEDIRYEEAKLRHDIHALNVLLERELSLEAAAHVNKAKTSADTTQPARALQIKDSLEVLIDSIENLRDIAIERSVEWKDIPHMDTSHWYDAMPTVAGRPFAFYAEMLQSGLDVLKFVYNHSIRGKWADATGNHHGASALGIDGSKLQKEYCKDLGISYMTAPAQVPGLEFEADVFYALSRVSGTMGNVADFIRWGRSSDVALFRYTGKKGKGSTSMPHKDLFGGNPIAEEQVGSQHNYAMGNAVTGLANVRMAYSRDLTASADARVNLEDGFKFVDHVARRLADVVYHLGIDQNRAKERIDRTFGITTSSRIMTYLTDLPENPMSRSEAHNLMGKLATQAYTEQTPFVDVLLAHVEVTSRLSEKRIRLGADPYTYLGKSKQIIGKIERSFYKKKTL